MRRTISFLQNSSTLRYIHTSKGIRSISCSTPAWQDVLYLTMFSQEDDVCAVCLDGHKAPVVLSCGHVFCAVCISSHEMLNEGAKCPCCYDSKAIELGSRPAKLERVKKVVVGRSAKFILRHGGGRNRVVMANVADQRRVIGKMLRDLGEMIPENEREAMVRIEELKKYERAMQELEVQTEASGADVPPPAVSQAKFYQCGFGPTFLSPFTFRQLNFDGGELPESVHGSIVHVQR